MFAEADQLEAKALRRRRRRILRGLDHASGAVLVEQLGDRNDVLAVRRRATRPRLARPRMHRAPGSAHSRRRPYAAPTTAFADIRRRLRAVGARRASAPRATSRARAPRPRSTSSASASGAISLTPATPRSARIRRNTFDAVSWSPDARREQLEAGGDVRGLRREKRRRAAAPTCALLVGVAAARAGAKRASSLARSRARRSSAGVHARAAWSSGFQIVDRGDDRAGQRRVPSKETILHRAPDALDRGRELGERRNLRHRRRAAQRARRALHGFAVGTYGAAPPPSNNASSFST